MSELGDPPVTQTTVPTEGARLLEDRVCLVVGAASVRGIGYATAELFAAHGAKVVVADIRDCAKVVHELNASAPSRAGGCSQVVAQPCDIADAAACDDLIDRTLGHFGRIDAMINAAGVVEGAPFLDITGAGYERMMTVNLAGAFNLCRSVLPILIRQKCGSIVNFASAAAQRGGGLVGGAHYAASKAGVIGLTRSIAREFGQHGVRANVVSPAMIRTEMLDGVTTDRYADIVGSIPLQRVGLPSEVAGVCLFLASDLSAFVTGATIDVNGGSHIH